MPHLHLVRRTVLLSSVIATLHPAIPATGRQQEANRCLQSIVPFEISTLEAIVRETDRVLGEGRGFWDSERPLVLAQGWADEVGSRNPYERFEDSVRALASLSVEDRRAHALLRMTDELVARQEEWQKAAIPHLCSFFPDSVELGHPAHFVAFIPPRAFATSEGIVIDVASDYWRGSPDNILNTLVHEYFHLGYGQLRPGRTETPLENARMNSIAEAIQNEGMAVWVAFQALGDFPAPGEVDNRHLGDPETVAGLREALNGLFERAPSIADEFVGRQAWTIGVTNRAYYVVGADMARTIERELGKEALIRTLRDGPLSFIRLYNSLVEDGERLKLPELALIP